MMCIRMLSQNTVFEEEDDQEETLYYRVKLCLRAGEGIEGLTHSIFWQCGYIYWRIWMLAVIWLLCKSQLLLQADCICCLLILSVFLLSALIDPDGFSSYLLCCFWEKIYVILNHYLNTKHNVLNWLVFSVSENIKSTKVFNKQTHTGCTVNACWMLIVSK